MSESQNKYDSSLINDDLAPIEQEKEPGAPGTMLRCGLA